MHRYFCLLQLSLKSCVWDQVSLDEFAHGLSGLERAELSDFQTNKKLGVIMLEGSGHLDIEQFVWVFAKPALQSLFYQHGSIAYQTFLNAIDSLEHKTPNYENIECDEAIKTLMRALSCSWLKDSHLRYESFSSSMHITLSSKHLTFV